LDSVECILAKLGECFVKQPSPPLPNIQKNIPSLGKANLSRSFPKA